MAEYFLNVINYESQDDTQTKEAFCETYRSSNCNNEYNQIKLSLLEMRKANQNLFQISNLEFILF
jgi:hypothetical protein